MFFYINTQTTQMPQFATPLRLFFSASPRLAPLKPSLSLVKFRPFSFFTAISSSFSKRRNAAAHQSFNIRKRSNSTFKEGRSRDIDRNRNRDKGLPMEETQSLGFNKRKAEGGDKSDKPKRNLQHKERKLNPVNTIAYVQILGTGMDTQDTSPSVLLFFDKQRFIFNAGEGLQRFCTEHKIKLSKIDYIFLSRVCSETAGGLPGLLLTLAGIGEQGMSVNVWGPSELKYLVDAMKCFIPHAAMVHTKSSGSTSSDAVALPKFVDPIVLVEDEIVKISALLLQPSSSQRSATKPADMSVVYVCELPEIMGKFDPAKAKALGLKPGPKYRELQLGNSVKSDRHDIMVHPSDVMDPSVPGPIIFLVDCPTESHVQELLSMESLNNYYVDPSSNGTENTKTVNCVIHLSPTSIVRSPLYQKWMKKLGSAEHIIAGHEMKNVEIPILKSSARIAARLNYLCPQFFPAPGFWSVKHFERSSPESIIPSEGPVAKLCESISAENLLKYTLRPYAHLGLDRSCIPSLISPSDDIDELLLETPNIADAAQQLRNLWHEYRETKEEIVPVQGNGVITEEPWLDEKTEPPCLENIRRDDLEIVLLGTGSSQPSKYRNVSAVYINLFSRGSVLLDCGEGTLGQLKRRYGVEGADNAVRNLSCIWISHIHADHHTGLARILALRRDLLKGIPHRPLLVVGPRQLKSYLDAYERLEDLDMQFLDCRNTMEASWDAFQENIESDKDFLSAGSPGNLDKMDFNRVTANIESTIFARGSPMQSCWKSPGTAVHSSSAFPLLRTLKEVLTEAGLEILISFPVVHCPQAFGISLKSSERINSVGKVIPGWKIVYSGDTRPCPQLVEAARGATVLIHEATFEDGLMEEAVAKNHSTTKEAIEAGDSAGAYRIILTHFSQRYPKIPVFDETHMHKTCIGFDMMSVNIADLPVLPKILPYIKLLFRDEMVVEDESDDVVGVVSAIL